MPYSSGVFTRTDGVRSGSDVFVQQKNSSITVTASLLDTEAQDMATGLSTCLLKDGTQTITANIPFGGFKLTGVGTGTARTDAANIGSLQDSAINYGGTAGGSANVLTLTLSPAITAYTTGMRIVFIAASANTTAATVAVNGLSAITIKKRASVAGGAVIDISPGDLINDAGYSEIIYNGTNFILENPANVWNAWVPVHTGFSVDPVAVARYRRDGNTVTCSYNTQSTGTSNTTGFTISAPFTARTVANMGWSIGTLAQDSGSTVPASVIIASAGTVFTVSKAFANPLTWTSSGAKGVYFTLTYEVA